MIAKFIKNLLKFSKPEQEIKDEIYLININRVFYLSLASIPMRIFSILIFMNRSPAVNEREALWQRGIISSHTSYLVLLLILLGLSNKYRKLDKPNLLMIGTVHVAVAASLLFGVIITLVDQLAMPSITPYVIANVAVGVIFLINPLHTLNIYIVGYLIYYFGMGILQPDASILLSNRINGITTTVLGILLAIILWSSNVKNLKQKNFIICQQKELEKINDELQYLASHDSLTGLLNRRCFEDKVSSEILRIQRYEQESALLILDIDNFKEINDKYGHPVGDSILQGFSSLIKAELRETDVFARIGGEEFAILLINTDVEAGRRVAEKIRGLIEKETFVIDNQEVHLTVSIGVTSMDDGTENYAEIYRFADRALYRAKTQGKNKIDIVTKSDKNAEEVRLT